MSFFKDLGQFAGKVTGRVLGGSVRVVGEVAGSPFIKDVGNSVERATIATGQTAGQLASGTYEMAKGVIKQDESTLQHGISDINGAVTNTAKGVVASAKYVYDSGKDVVTGLRDDDLDKAKQGAKGLVAAAAVSALAIGILDVVDGPEGLGDMADGGMDAGLADVDSDPS